MQYDNRRQRSSFGVVLVVFLVLGLFFVGGLAVVGVGLWAYYNEHPMSGAAMAMLAEQPDRVFPIFITEVVPAGFKGLAIAGAFAAAISSLDSILAALSQTTLSLIYHPERGDVKIGERELLRRSRWLVVVWGIILTAFTFFLNEVRESIPILPLAFGMPTTSSFWN